MIADAAAGPFVPRSLHIPDGFDHKQKIQVFDSLSKLIDSLIVNVKSHEADILKWDRESAHLSLHRGQLVEHV